MKVAAFPGKLGGLSLPESFASRQKLFEGGSVLPIQLIDGPGRDRRFGQRFHAVRHLVSTGFFELGGKRVARGDELGRRQLKQPVDLLVFSFSHVT